MAQQTIQIADKPTLDQVKELILNQSEIIDSLSGLQDMSQVSKNIIDTKHSIWLNDYKTYGDSSYVKIDPNKYNELIKNYELCMNDLKIMSEALSYAIENDELGLALRYYQQFEARDVMVGKVTLDDIISNIDSLNALCQDELTLETLTSNDTFTNSINGEYGDSIMESLATNKDWITNLCNNETTYNFIKGCDSCDNFYNALANNVDMMTWLTQNENIYSVMLKEQKFIDIVENYSDAVSIVITNLADYILTNGTKKTISGITYNTGAFDTVVTIRTAVSSGHYEYQSKHWYSFVRAGASYTEDNGNTVVIDTSAYKDDETNGYEVYQPYTAKTVTLNRDDIKSIKLETCSHSYVYTSATASASAVIITLPLAN